MKKRNKKSISVAIVGTGYVGLVTGISLARLGHKVICIDQIKDKVLKINSGTSPIYEPGINKMLKKVIQQGIFSATDRLEETVQGSDIIIIAVGTPTINNKIDLSAIKKVSEQIGQAIKNTKKYQVITVKSTVLPGVTENVVKPTLEKFSGKKVGQFGLCMNPEFLREGNALEDALNPDRIIIGQIDKKSGQSFAKIYQKVKSPKILTDLKTAELTKYASNALFATLISFSNEIARISESIDEVDVMEVWKGVHLDRRLSPLNGKSRIKPGVLSYILSGCGFGGSCFPKDIQALASFAKKLGSNPGLINSVININKTQPLRIIRHLKNALGGNIKGKKIAVLGLTFKPNTDDLRESAAFPIINSLISEGARVICHDPVAYKKDLPKILTDLPIRLTTTAQEAIKNTDAAIIVTAWDEYVRLPAKFFKKHMNRPIVIDGRRIYDKKSFQEYGLIYKGIGL